MPDALIRSATAEALRERASGLVLTLCAFALLTVWAIDSPPTVRLGVTAVIGLGCTLWLTVALQRRARLRTLRTSQMEAHRTKRDAATPPRN